MVEKVLREV